MVTGASAGLGRAFVLELARRGVEIVAVARDSDRLKSLAASVDVAVEVMPADLAVADQLEAVAQRCADQERSVDLLVNNAGIWDFGMLGSAEVGRVKEMVALNVAAVVRLSTACIGRMLSEGKGAILNVSSVAGEQPLPFEAVYAASKAFVTNFGQGLHEEVRARGVTVTTVLPGLTRTELHTRAGCGDQIKHYPPWLWMEPERVAVLSLRALSRRRAVCVPGFGYGLCAAISQLIPRYPKRKLAAVINRRRMEMT